MKAKLFLYAKPVQHDLYGECRMEVWRIYHSEENTVREPETIVEYYQRGHLIERSY